MSLQSSEAGFNADVSRAALFTSGILLLESTRHICFHFSVVHTS